MNLIRLFPSFLERFLGTDVRYLAHGSFWLTVGRGSGAFVAFLLSLLYARYLPKELYGNYRYILSMLGAFGIFVLPGVATVITRAVARGFEGTFLRGARLIFFTSFIVTLCGFIAAGWFFLHGNAALGWGFVIAGLLTPFAEGLGNWRAYFDGLRRFREKTLWNIIAIFFQGVMMAGAVASIFFLNLSPAVQIIVLVGAFYVSHGLPNIIWHRYTSRFIAKESTSEPGALRYGLQLSALDALSTIANYFDGILLYFFLGPVALAVYTFALAPVEQMKGFLGAIGSVALPKFSLRTYFAHDKEELRRTLPKKIIRSSLLTTALVLCYIAVAPFLFAILFPAYQEAVPLSRVFALSLALFPFGMFGAALKMEGNLKKVYVYQIGVPLIQIIFLVVLIPSYGLWGAIAARLIGRFAIFGFEYILFVWRS